MQYRNTNPTRFKLTAQLVLALSLLIGSSVSYSQTLRIATEGYYAPFNYFDDEGKLAGFDVDISMALCEVMQKNCDMVQNDWDDLIPDLNKNEYDVIVASMSITSERETKVDFTLPYYSNMLTFLGKKNNNIEISPQGLSGKTVGTLRSTVSSNYLKENYSDVVDIKLYDTQEDALSDLVSKKLDLVLGDNLPSYDWLQSEAGQNHEFVGEFIDINDRISIAIRKSNPQLLEALNSALIEIIENGTYQEINAKYFPFSIYF